MFGRFPGVGLGDGNLAESVTLSEGLKVCMELSEGVGQGLDHMKQFSVRGKSVTEYREFLPDAEATGHLGARLARLLVPGVSVWLAGDLGAGKTCLVRGLLRALGETGPVKSPTYPLLEMYELPLAPVYHFDFYRFVSPEAFLETGFETCFEPPGISLVEWPEKALPYLPPPDLRVALFQEGAGRCALVQGASPKGEQCLIHWNPPSL